MMETLFFPFFIGVWFILMGLAVLAFVFWILMIVDCAKRKFKNDNDKVIWIIILALTGWIGALIYYFVIKRPNKH